MTSPFHFLRRCHPRRALLASLVLAPLLGVLAPVQAQDYPSKPIRLVIPYPPGGATDVIGRVMAQQLTTALGQQVIVDNRAGATGSIGAALVAKAPADRLHAADGRADQPRDLRRPLRPGRTV